MTKLSRDEILQAFESEERVVSVVNFTVVHIRGDKPVVHAAGCRDVAHDSIGGYFPTEGVTGTLDPANYDIRPCAY